MEKHGLINTQRPSCEALFLYWNFKLKFGIQSRIYSASLSAVTSHRLSSASQDSCNNVCVFFFNWDRSQARPLGIYGGANSTGTDFTPIYVVFLCERPSTTAYPQFFTISAMRAVMLANESVVK
jgi:hypothetical protein